MYIDPFWAGVLSTIFAEMLAILLWAMFGGKKK